MIMRLSKLGNLNADKLLWSSTIRAIWLNVLTLVINFSAMMMEAVFGVSYLHRNSLVLFLSVFLLFLCRVSIRSWGLEQRMFMEFRDCVLLWPLLEQMVMFRS
ncbi:hypothetical protein F2Q70_00024717 [Brassica cretica]|uniref:Uncharacterized protein n=1 Tax=Brassica cretica TaxID=69181 RepID=A0A8S9L285_BRACR|nr:hypothetical protein F2Q70_00024717 [Brassica cretica]